jgi:type IV pilus assembly protein PilV
MHPMTSARGIQTRCGEGGFTLLEVLIAIVIFSIGLLGIAGLQVSGMRFTQDSQLRAIAVAQAEAMADRMRANPRGFKDGLYNMGAGMPTSYPVDCYAAQCTREQLATFDLVTWNLPAADPSRTPESNADVLPGGKGVVCLDSTPDDGEDGAWACDNTGDLYAIKVRWTERAIGAEDTADTAGGDTVTKGLFIRVLPYADVAGDGF